MSNPHEPDDDPTAAHEDTPAETSDDAAWRSIIENYGDRAELPELPEDEPAAEIQPGPHATAYPAEPDERPEPADPEDHFVPPTPPPLPRPAPPRLIAWLGLFGVPAFVLVALLTRIDLPTWSGLLLMIWFIGGFVYLVASMRPGPRDDYDDGAVL